MKRKGTRLRFEAGSTTTNFITDPDGVLIGLLIPAGGEEADITFQEAIGRFHNVAEEDLTVVPLTLKDGTTEYTVTLPPDGGLVMVGLDTGAAGSEIPLKNFRLVSSEEQVAQLDITPIFEVGR